MGRSQKVVWSEGLFLTPHLFQQHERYHEDLLHFRLKPFTAFYWGLLDYDIDTDALATGSFRLNRCNGIMPDGLPIQMPSNDPLPPSRSFKEEKIFPSSAATLEVFLAIPEEQTDKLNISLDKATNGTSVRYQMQLAQVSDDTTGDNEHEISLACKNYKILFSGERLDAHVLLKMAEIGRTSSGSFTLGNYIAACLRISASNQLMTILRGLWDVLSSKSTSISAQRRHITEFAGSDIANFWLLHTTNSYIPILSHFYNAKHHHPEHLYLALCQLAGELSTFALDAFPAELPLYDHDNLYQTFAMLDARIRRLIETVIPTRFVIIPLDKREQWHVGQVHDERLLGSAKFYLGVRAQVAANKLIQEIPVKAKVSSPGEINDLIGRAVPGVELTHEAVPPSDLPVTAGFRYFQLHTQGRWWEVIRQSKGLAIYIVDEFPELELQLIAVKGS